MFWLFFKNKTTSLGAKSNPPSPTENYGIKPEPDGKYIIPKYLHFVWAGGEKIMPERSFTTVFKWVLANPNLKYFIWIDYTTYPGGKQALKKKYKEELQIFIDKRSDVRLKKLNVDPDSPDCIFQFKDIEEEQIADNGIRYDIDKYHPDFGKSSDKIRYKILYKYGGVYFDSDVWPTQFNLENSGIFDPINHHMIYWNNKAQSPHPHKSKAVNFHSVSNDALATTPKNPDMLKMIEIASGKPFIWQNLRSTKRDPEIEALYKLDHKLFIKENTPYWTGPMVLTWAGLLTIHTWQPRSEFIKPLMIDGQSLVRTPSDQPSDNAWLKTFTTNYTTRKQALKKISNSLKYEAKTLGILRLDEHIGYLMNTGFFSKEEAIKFMLDILENESELLNKVGYVDCKYLYRETIDFAKKHDLHSKIPLWPDNKNFIYAVNFVIDRTADKLQNFVENFLNNFNLIVDIGITDSAQLQENIKELRAFVKNITTTIEFNNKMNAAETLDSLNKIIDHLQEIVGYKPTYKTIM